MQSSQYINSNLESGNCHSGLESGKTNRNPGTVLAQGKQRASCRQRVIAALIFSALSVFFGSFAIAAHSNTDMGQYLGRCGFKQIYGFPCPTCGYTTVTIAFVQGKILDAFYIQPACGLICSILVFTGIISFIIAAFGIRFKFVSRFFTEVKILHIIFALIVIIASGWAVTLARAFAQK